VARYSLFVLKVPLKCHQPTSQWEFVDVIVRTDLVNCTVWTGKFLVFDEAYLRQIDIAAAFDI